MNQLRLIGLSLMTVVLQGSFFTHFPIKGATLHLALPFIVNVGFHMGSTAGALCGAGIGLLEDISTGNAIGLRALLYFWIGFTAGHLRKGFNDDDAKPAVGVTFLATFAFFFIHAFLNRFMSQTAGFMIYLQGPIVIEAIMNTLAAWILHYVLKKVLILPRLYS